VCVCVHPASFTKYTKFHESLMHLEQRWTGKILRSKMKVMARPIWSKGSGTCI